MIFNTTGGVPRRSSSCASTTCAEAPSPTGPRYLRIKIACHRSQSEDMHNHVLTFACCLRAEYSCAMHAERIACFANAGLAMPHEDNLPLRCRMHNAYRCQVHFLLRT